MPPPVKDVINNFNIGEVTKNSLAKSLDVLVDQLIGADSSISKKDAEKIASEVLKEATMPLSNLDQHARELVGTAQEIHKLLTGDIPTNELPKANFKVKELLRSAFENKAYQALKECEDNPTIRYLHEVNLSMYTETPLLSAYLPDENGESGLGEQMYQFAVKNDVVLDETKPGTFLEEMRDKAVSEGGLFSSHTCMKYVKEHFTQFFGAVKSMKMGAAFGDYDPAGKLGNNVGALSTETFTVNGKKASVVDVRTPSPTIGNHASPEFKAGLQAIENQRISILSGGEDYGRPNMYLYTNNQDITGDGNGENQRSLAIMKLNDEFPMSFRGNTLSKDSDYFLDGLGHGKEMWNTIEQKNEKFSLSNVGDFVAEMKEVFKDENHFSLENRTKTEHKGAGLYFHTRNGEERAGVEAMLDEIAEATGAFLREKLADGKSYTGKDAWQLKSAAKAFAYAAIQGKQRNLELVAQEKQGIKEPKAITTSACKEDIDRGFTDHIIRMWLRGKANVETLIKVINMPALMARYRVILGDRIQPFVALADLFDRDKASALYESATSVDGVSSTGWELYGVKT